MWEKGGNRFRDLAEKDKENTKKKTYWVFELVRSVF